MPPPVATVHTGNAGDDSVPVTDPKIEQQEQDNRPDWLPENFKTVDDYVASNKETQAELTRLQQAKGENQSDPKTNTDQTPDSGPPADVASATKVVTDAGLNMDELSAEYLQNDKLSENTYTALEAKGVKRTDVDKFIEGQKALGTQSRLDIYSVVGGEETFKKIAEWIPGNLPDDEAAIYDAAAASGNVKLTKMVLEGIYAKYQEAVGTVGDHVAGDPSAASGDVYESNEQLVADQMTDLYKRDPAEQARVAKKLMRSKL